jgi:hypothetical protein
MQKSLSKKNAGNEIAGFFVQHLLYIYYIGIAGRAPSLTTLFNLRSETTSIPGNRENIRPDFFAAKTKNIYKNV